MASKKLISHIPNYVGCLFQAFAKRENSEIKRLLKYALAEYAYNVLHSTHLEESKRMNLLLEIIHVLDKDTLSDEQFKEEVGKIRSSDEVRHFFKNAMQHYKTSSCDNEEEMEEGEMKSDGEEGEGEEEDIPVKDTFEDKYFKIDESRGKRKLEELKLYDSKKRKDNMNRIIKKITDYILNSENDFNIQIHSPNEISYSHKDYPFDERDLIGDIVAMFQGDNEITDQLPVSTLLTLLDVLDNSLKTKEISKLPSDYVKNIAALCKPYARFDTCKFFV